MNFLQLCQAARRECLGNNFVGAATPTTVVGQTGVLEKIVNNTMQAWVTLQELEPNWKFLRATKVHSLTIGTRKYSIASAVAPGMGIANLRLWNKNKMQIEEAATDKSDLRFEEWEDFRLRIISTTNNRPVVVTENEDGEIEFDVPPDKAYVVRLPYWKTATVLAADNDTPIINAELHEVIVWESVLRYAGADTASELYQNAAMMRDRLLRRMEVLYLPLPTSIPASPLPGMV